MNTSQLRATVSRDLDTVRDAYDIGVQALEQIEALFQSVQFEDKPIRAARELSAAYRDLANTLIALRDEGRQTIRAAAERLGSREKQAQQGQLADRVQAEQPPRQTDDDVAPE